MTSLRRQVWAECKQLWDEGLTGYVRQWWNWLDFVMLSIYICSFSLRAVAYFQIRSGSYGCRSESGVAGGRRQTLETISKWRD